MRLLIAPGMDWNVTISFVGNDEMYRVWSLPEEVFGILDRASEYSRKLTSQI